MVHEHCFYSKPWQAQSRLIFGYFSVIRGMVPTIYVLLPVVMHCDKRLLPLHVLIIQSYPQLAPCLGNVANFGPTTNSTKNSFWLSTNRAPCDTLWLCYVFSELLKMPATGDFLARSTKDRGREGCPSRAG